MVEAVRGAFGEWGKLAITILLTVVLGITTWGLTKTVSHTEDLATIKESLNGLNNNVLDLKQSVSTRFSLIDGDIGHLVNVQETIDKEVAKLQEAQAIHEMQDSRMAPRRVNP